MSRLLSIMQIISSAEWGGREQHVKELARGLQDCGHRVMIVTRNNAFHVRRYREVAETQVLRLRNLVDFRSIAQLAAWICEREIDCIHVHTGRDAWLALLATKWAGRGKVFNSRHTVSQVKTDFLHRWYYRNLAAVICVSNMVRQEFLAACPLIAPDKAVVVYNGIDTRPFLQLQAKIPFLQEPFLIGYAGRISPEKGLEHLVEAVGILRRDGYKQVKLVLAGNAKADYKLRLEELICKWDLQACVEFAGFQEEIASFISALDAFVLPCVWQEAFGLVLCEAMVCGKPVISTKTGAQKELIESGVNGLLIDSPSGSEVAAALKGLIDEPALAQQFGERARETVLQRFTLEHMVERMIDCYRRGGA
ncbi:glycosyltransferase family 4 protein [Azotosporobacter soli]|uniref:glycosyltransferase family 4 protein n=1 Tax=Azotosporobacter soli TaxID=3055040 RepID=UPI0031FE605F